MAAYRMITNDLGSWIKGCTGPLCASVSQGLSKKGTLRWLSVARNVVYRLDKRLQGGLGFWYL